MKSISFFCLLMFFWIPLFSQVRAIDEAYEQDVIINKPYQIEYENPVMNKGFFSLGFGLGLPYGGLGFRAGYNVANRFSAFGAVGYNFVETGFNVGIQYDFAVKKRNIFYLSGMAGYNSLTLVIGEPEYNKTFYGPSFGIGLKHDSKKESGNFLQIGLLVPLRSQSFFNMIETIENNPGIEGIGKPWPILFTIGYNMGFGGF